MAGKGKAGKGKERKGKERKRNKEQGKGKKKKEKRKAKAKVRGKGKQGKGKGRGAGKGKQRKAQPFGAWKIGSSPGPLAPRKGGALAPLASRKVERSLALWRLGSGRVSAPVGKIERPTCPLAPRKGAQPYFL